MNLHQQIAVLKARRTAYTSECWVLTAERDKFQKGRKKNAFSTWELSITTTASEGGKIPFYVVRKLTLEECFGVLWQTLENITETAVDHQALDGFICALDKEGVELVIRTCKTDASPITDNSFQIEAVFETPFGDKEWNITVPPSEYPPAAPLSRRWVVAENTICDSFGSN